MSINKITYRRCIVTKEVLPINLLFKCNFIDNKVFIDKEKKIKGRSFYIKKDLTISQNLEKTKQFFSELKRKKLKLENIINLEDFKRDLARENERYKN